MMKHEEDQADKGAWQHDDKAGKKRSPTKSALPPESEEMYEDRFGNNSRSVLPEKYVESVDRVSNVPSTVCGSNNTFPRSRTLMQKVAKGRQGRISVLLRGSQAA